MSQPVALTETCAECEQDLAHCHGTAIVHFDGSADCTDDPDCRLAAEQHLFEVSCAEAECSRGSARTGVGGLGAGWSRDAAAAS
jgi:hypothetical protein